MNVQNRLLEYCHILAFLNIKTKQEQFFQLKNRKFNLVKSVTTPEISFLDKY